MPAVAAAATLPPFVAALNFFGLSLNLVIAGVAGATETSTEELLFVVSVSLALVVTLAVLLSAPADVGCTTIAAVVACPGASVPSAQMTVVVPEQLP